MAQRPHRPRSRWLSFLVMLPVWVAWTAIQHHANVARMDHSRNNDAAASEAAGYTPESKRQQEPQPTDPFAYSIFQQSLCDAKSPFASLGGLDETVDDRPTGSTTRTITTWAARLVYLMLHEHQNHKDLQDSVVCSDTQKHNTTKFLVFSYGKNGLGANMRLGAVPALMLGLVTDRVVVNVNQAHYGPGFLQEAWPWATCSLGSAECDFRPLATTPCWDSTLLETAHVLTRAEARSAFRTGQIPSAHRDDRVLILHVTFRPQREPDTLRSVVASKVQEMARRFQWTHSAVFREALALIAAVPTVSEGDYDYYGVNSVIFHGLLLYAMRPNPFVVNDLKEKVDDVSQSFDTSTLGMPIRASDKCGTESQCLKVNEYVAAAMEVRPTATSIFITTEAKPVLESVRRFAAETSLTHILTNHHDMLPDTGFLADSTASLGDVIPAALSSMQAQFRTSFVMVNCCSNFHLLIKDFVDVGCGIVEHVQCLQTHMNESYRICCSWDRDCRLTPP